MSEKQQSSAPAKTLPPPQGTPDFLLAEYSALRDEILKRSEIQHQLVSLSLIATGTFLTIGSTTATLAYPILATFLAAAWAQNDFRIRQMGMYIKKRIEEKLLGSNLGWEHVHASSPSIANLGSLSLFASRGIFVGTQILTVLISLLKTSFPTENIVLLVLDGLAITFSLLILRRHTINLE